MYSSTSVGSYGPGGLILNAVTANTTLKFENPINLIGGNTNVVDGQYVNNGAITNRIEVDSPTYAAILSGALSTADPSGNTIISNSGSSLLKLGVGTLVLTASNTYNCATAWAPACSRRGLPIRSPVPPMSTSVTPTWDRLPPRPARWTSSPARNRSSR